MLSPHEPYAHSLIVKLSEFPTEEDILERFPHVVYHDVRFASEKWRHMVKWLRVTVGEPEQAWGWRISSQLRFKNESDAALFSITWS